MGTDAATTRRAGGLEAALDELHAGLAGQRARWRTALVLAFHAGDLVHAREVLREAAGELTPVVALDEVLAPAMHDIGALWERDEVTIADEHLATAVTHRLLAEVAPSLVTAPVATPQTVLLATTPSERHTAGLLMAGDVLAGAGHRTIALGAGVPLPALVAALERHAPSVVGLSATMPVLRELRATAQAVKETLPGIALVVGGAAADGFPPALVDARVERLATLLDAVAALTPR